MGGEGWTDVEWATCRASGREGQCCCHACYAFLQAAGHRNPHFLFLRASPSTRAPTRRMPRVTAVAALHPSPHEIPCKVQPPRPCLSLPVCSAAVPGCVSVPSSAQFPGLLWRCPGLPGMASEAMTLLVRRFSLIGSMTSWWRRESS